MQVLRRRRRDRGLGAARTCSPPGRSRARSCSARRRSRRCRAAARAGHRASALQPMAYPGRRAPPRSPPAERLVRRPRQSSIPPTDACREPSALSVRTPVGHHTGSVATYRRRSSKTEAASAPVSDASRASRGRGVSRRRVEALKTQGLRLLLHRPRSIAPLREQSQLGTGRVLVPESHAIRGDPRLSAPVRLMIEWARFRLLEPKAATLACGCQPVSHPGGRRFESG